ncbi:MAG: hypothetical protein JSW68_10745 [Burkholderiales bacterium]|nr:MAG: hypothetical protein JSW68_10745 [Burkholderiales bacterium]
MTEPAGTGDRVHAGGNAAGIRYGVRVAGIGLLLPAEVPVEYLDGATVYPVPRLPRRVLGLLQVRGHPVPVLAPDAGFEPHVPGLQRMNVVVIGAGAMAGALPVDAPPQPLPELAPAADATFEPPSPAGPLAALLEQPLTARSDSDRDTLWWRFEPARLFEMLARAE